MAETDPTRDAFDREVTSDAFWDNLAERRAATTLADKLAIACRYRHARAVQAAAELREDRQIAARIRERDARDTGNRTPLRDAAERFGIDLDEL